MSDPAGRIRLTLSHIIVLQSKNSCVEFFATRNSNERLFGIV